MTTVGRGRVKSSGEEGEKGKVERRGLIGVIRIWVERLGYWGKLFNLFYQIILIYLSICKRPNNTQL